MSHKQETPIVGITGGKGGTGKTTVAVNLSVALAEHGLRILLLDCDVDAPDAHQLLGVKLAEEREVHSFLPEIEQSTCIHCGKCAKACRAHALIQVGEKTPILFPDLCSGCEACRLVCPTGAVKESYKVMGWTYRAKRGGIGLVSGRLKLGEAESAVVVQAVRERAEKLLSEGTYDIALVDTAPGAHCDVLRALYGARYALAVTEPTPFGAHDLELILRLLDTMRIPAGVVLNRSNITERRELITGVCEKHGVRLVAEIPLDRAMLDCYIRGEPVVLCSPEAPGARALRGLAERVLEVLGL